MASFIYVDNLRKILIENGYYVDILDKNREEYVQFSESIIPVNKIENEFEDYFFYSKIKKYISTKYDLILLYNFSSYESLRIMRFCKKNSIKIGAISTEWKDWHSDNFFKSLTRGIDIFTRMRIINKLMDCNICCSKYFMEYYKSHNPFYIPTLTENGVGISYKKIKYPLNLIYIGIPTKHKENLSIFIKALISSSLIKKSRFDLYGLTKQDFYYIFKDFEDCLDKYTNIVFHGVVSQGQIKEALASADFSIIYREKNRANCAGFPTKMGTSLSNGVPVLATSVGDVSSFISDGYNGYILPNDYQNLLYFLNHIGEYVLSDSVLPINTNSLFWGNYINNLDSLGTIF